MQCQSYLPAYHSQYEVNLEANGGLRQMYNGNGTFRNGHYNNYTPSIPVPQGQFDYKELLRQTMLMQEITFRNQVQELHRLYKRQKDLMGEIKSKELSVNNLQLELQFSNSSSAKLSSVHGQNAQHSIPFHNSQYGSCSGDTDSNQRALNCSKEQKTPDSHVFSQCGGTVHPLHIPETKGKKIGGKLLDLELPAEFYIDSDEGEYLKDAEFSQGPVLITVPSLQQSNFVIETDKAAYWENSLSDTVLQGGVSSPPSFRGTSGDLANLNEPPTTLLSEKSDLLQGNEVTPEISERNHFSIQKRDVRSDRELGRGTTKSFGQYEEAKSEVLVGSCGSRPSCNLQNNSLVVQALPCMANQLRSTRGVKSIRSKGYSKEKFDASRGFDTPTSVQGFTTLSSVQESVACMSSTSPAQLKHVNGSNYIDLNSAFTADADFMSSDDTSCCEVFTEVVGASKYAKTQNPVRPSLACEDVVTLKQNGLDHFHSLDSETTRKSKRCRVIDINLPCDPSEDEEPLIEHDLTGHDGMGPVQINLNMYMSDDGLPPKSTSADNCAVEIDLDAPLSPEVEERPPPRVDSEENLPEVADQSSGEECGEPLVELVKIAAEAIVCISSSKPPLSSKKSHLQHLEAPDSRCLEWFAGVIQSLSTELDDDFATLKYNAIDDFEAMTLELTDMKAEDDWCQNTVQMLSTMSVTGQTRKGRKKRSKRKDFQKEILPSLASLSRYEVTEDIQMIEGLLEAAGTPWQLRTRRACRMGRKHLLLKRQTSATDVQEGGFVLSWGKVNRRPRGQRSPASSFAVRSRWLEFAN